LDEARPTAARRAAVGWFRQAHHVFEVKNPVWRGANAVFGGFDGRSGGFVL
jgi:hypothetical protein